MENPNAPVNPDLEARVKKFISSVWTWNVEQGWTSGAVINSMKKLISQSFPEYIPNRPTEATMSYKQKIKTATMKRIAEPQFTEEFTSEFNYNGKEYYAIGLISFDVDYESGTRQTMEEPGEAGFHYVTEETVSIDSFQDGGGQGARVIEQGTPEFEEMKQALMNDPEQFKKFSQAAHDEQQRKIEQYENALREN